MFDNILNYLKVDDYRYDYKDNNCEKTNKYWIL